MKTRVAIVAALARELRPLIKNWKRESCVGGVSAYSSEHAIVVVGGMGGRRAEMALETALSFGAVRRVISAGLAGGLHPGMAVGSVQFVDGVIDAATGQRFRQEDESGRPESGDTLMVTMDHVVSAAEKQRLRSAYFADLVDMEGAAVARAAHNNGLPFLAIKAVSDEWDFALPGMEAFATPEGQIREGAFALYTALRPGLWGPVIRLGRNSAVAIRHLCAELEQYLAWDTERSKLPENG